MKDEPAACARIKAGCRAPVAERDFYRRYLKAKMILGGILVACAFLAVGFKSMFSIDVPKGSPLAESIRAGNDIVTLIQTLEPYVPSLHRNPENNRYRVSLFILPSNGSPRSNVIPIGKGYRSNDLRLARVLGFDGATVWSLVSQLEGLNPKTGRRVNAAKLRDANPTLDETWDDPRRMTFDTRLRVASRDGGRLFEVDPQTLKALPILADGQPAQGPLRNRPDNLMGVDARPSPTTWLALLSAKEAELHYKPKSLVQPITRAENANALRRMHMGQLGPELARGNREILGIKALSSDTYFNAAFLRSSPEGAPIRLSSPDGFLMTYTASSAYATTLMVARVTAEGQVVWKTDTGLHRFLLNQILPDGTFPAFVGTPPPVLNKVSEPMLVIINIHTGQASSTSLWQ